MPADFSQIGPYLLVALIVFVVYRRLRRSFGRQPLRPGRMTFRICLLALVSVLLAPMALRSISFAAAALCGLLAGVSLAAWGASQTRFEQVGGQRFYVPHTYTGIAVSLLFIGRVAFRLLKVYGIGQGATITSAVGPPSTPAGYVRSPLTLGIFYVLAGYYVCYLSWVLWKSKRNNSDGALEGASRLGTDPGAPS